MILFLKGFIIGIAKIIPGVSGAMIAVSFSIYDKLIDAITHFFDNKKDNFKFLVNLGSGMVLAIIFFSKIVGYLINRFYFVMMMLFLGLIFGGAYGFAKNIKYNKKNILIILFVSLFIIGISIFNFNDGYMMNGNYIDYIMYFLGGMIEIFTSIVPGISGTALLMLLGIYDEVLLILGNISNVSFVINNIIIYISYGFGLFISFIICSILISYLLKKYRNLFDTIIFGLCISSIFLLGLMIFRISFSLIELILGIILFFVGITISYLLEG